MRREDLLEKFLNEEGIYTSSKEEVKNNFSRANCLAAITIFHNATSKKYNYSIGIISEAGKLYQEQKISFKRALKFQDEIDIDISDIIKIAQKSMNMIDEDEVVKIIKRSYDNAEITLGKVYLNIEMHDEKIYVCDIGRIRFGMVEDDFIKFARRNKRKSINYNKMIEKFCSNENLGESSKNYIKAILFYPKEIMDYLADCYIRDFHDENIINEKITDMKNNFMGIFKEE